METGDKKRKILIGVISAIMALTVLTGGIIIAVLKNPYIFASEPAEYTDEGDTHTANGKFIDFITYDIQNQFATGEIIATSEPVEFKILWLGYKDVSYESLQFTMNEEDEEYLRNVVENFEQTTEKMSDYEVDIQIDFYFVNDSRNLTYDGEFLYLDLEDAKQDINIYNKNRKYDSVITTVQAEGDENYERRQEHPEYSEEEYYVILGLCTHNFTSEYGYSTFNLSEPLDEKIYAPETDVPSLFATAVAVHEWLHQFDEAGEYLDIEYPQVHLYLGGDEYEGYEKYVENEKNYDFFELYEQILSGTVPYTSPDGERYDVGLNPRLWQYFKCTDVLLGQYTIYNSEAGQYLSVDEKGKLLLTEEKYYWDITFTVDNQYLISSSEEKDKYISLDDDNLMVCDNDENAYNKWSIRVNENRESIIENNDYSSFLWTDGYDCDLADSEKSASLWNIELAE